jgi:hypothetical protein
VTIQWQGSLNPGGPFTDISGATNVTYAAPTTVADTFYYQVVVNDPNSGCATPTSSVVQVIVAPDAQISATIDNPEVCIGGVSVLTATLTGGSGSVSLQWDNSSSAGGPFISIPGATNTTYTAATASDGVMYYRVRVLDSNGSSDCATPISNVLSVTVQPDAAVTVDVTNPEVCVGGSSLLISTLTGGSSLVMLQWQSADNAGGPFTDISGETDGVYIAPTTAAGLKYYRVVVSDPSNGCTEPISNVVSVLVNPDAVITVSLDNTEVCVGGSATITAVLTGGSSLATMQWQNSSSAGGPFVNIPGATNLTYSAPTTLVGTTYYRAEVSDPNSDCAEPISDVVSVTVYADAVIDVTASNSEVCVGGDATLMATVVGGSGNASLQWQSADDAGGPWTDIGGETNDFYSAPTGVAGVFYYRAIILDNNSGCATPTSDPSEIVVNDQVEIQALLDNAEICVGGLATMVAAISGGSSALSYHWQNSPDGASGWADVGVSNQPYIVSPGTAGIYYYRIRIEDSTSGCEQPFSEVVQLLVNEDAAAEVIVDNSEVCVGGSVMLTAIVTGGSSALTIQWESSTAPGGPFTAITGETNTAYNAPTGTPGITYYRIQVSDPNADCEMPSSNPTEVIVNEDAMISVFADNNEVCVGGSATFIATLTGGSSAVTLQWESSPNLGGPWTDISGETNSIYVAPTSVAGIVYYRVSVIDPNDGCAMPSSDVVELIVQEDVEVMVSVDNPEVCIGGSVILLASVSGGSSALTLQWESSSSPIGPFTQIPGETNSIYIAPTAVAGVTYYRVDVEDPVSGCESPESDPVEVIVNEDAEISVFADNDEVCVGGSVTFIATLNGGSSGATLQWEDSEIATGPFTAIPGETSPVFVAPTSNADTTYYRVSVNDPGSDCAAPVSDTIQLIVNSDPIVTAEIDDAEICVGGSVLLSTTITGGSNMHTVQWQSGPDAGGPWTDISGATDETYAPLTTIAGIYYYRVQITDDGSDCGDPASASVELIINDDVDITVYPSDAEVCVGESILLSAQVEGGSSALMIQWQIGPGVAGPWSDI